ncbi:MAG: hypothetical protein LQ343_003483 [Gyalolechia ehrenbergii]|nr:MAG: hypothetical protein LQ343_003483 [Gyalolechia ehrenbergii]
MARLTRILAAGSNVHGQLDPSAKPSNIQCFKQVGLAEDFDPNENTAIKAALWSSTIIAEGCRGMKHLGISGESRHSRIDMSDVPQDAAFFGDISGVKGYLRPFSGDLYTLQPSSTPPTITFKKSDFPPSHPLETDGSVFSHIAIAGNEKVCLVIRSCENPTQACRSSIHLHRTFLNFLRSLTDDVYDLEEDITSLAATATGFAALTGNGTLLTFGDQRYPALLGRTPSRDYPASYPSIVSALDGIPIAKIVAGSWMIAALSRDRDLYVWGHTLPQTPVRVEHAGLSALLNNVNEDGEREEVHLVDVAGGADVDDVAVGDEHVVVLTTKGEVWGLGSNEYGQLGLGQETKGTEGKWMRIDAISAGEEVIEINAGPFTTFLVVATTDVP